MTELIIMRGVSGCGKSTKAKAYADMLNGQVVSRDDIRLGFFGVEFDPNIEERVTVIEHAMIDAFLRKGIDVISDNTNIEWKYVKAIAKIGYRQGATVKVEAIDVPLKVCKERNDKRGLLGGRHVPHEVIEKQYSRFQGTKNRELDEVPPVKPYSGTPGKPKAFLVDIDGTLAHMRDYRGPFDWKKVGLDDADEVIVDLVNILGGSSFALDLDHLNVIVMSGRDEVCRQETIDWLENYINFDNLFMRPAGDMRPDNIVKAELFDKHVRDRYDVKFVLDDRDQVVDMWRRMGLTCLQVAPGDF